ncbi:hypothetical protein ONE63_005138 [Megalurothrips usitatus]|uniref:Helitron helicase-like domain-containing protein n=1 Tax=Megalurothrips usitatus TaxID=439358 RepID=A0AAV7XZE3_9NEOP|nr:hypothetical protein ONE63_005138 [Megalurothrips usitatus]
MGSNPFIGQFRQLAEEPAEGARLEFQLTSRARHGPVPGDRYTGTEVHAVLNVGDQLPGEPRHLTVWKAGDHSPSQISVLSPLMEPFQYPLLYPEGTLGWQVGRLDNAGKKLSLYNYARCLLLSEPRFSELGRLSQAWEVEMFARYEEEKLLYISNCQKEGGGMRVGPQDEVADAVRNPPQQLKELLRDIRSGALFGPTAYILYVIEMQMRGLPHAHIAIRVEDGGPVQGRDVDGVVRADIPGPEEAGGRLRELVLKHMIHGPCEGRSCWDAKERRCSKFYPKPAGTSTYTDEKGFVHYKRSHSNTARKGNRLVHDGWVVPWNAALLLKYDAHINLEISSTRRVIKYLFKYMTKGGSHQYMCVVPLHEQQDEPNEYARRRMIGASDACWRLLDFHLTVSEPSVTMLPVHLEGQHNVVFRPGREEDAIESSSSLLLLYLNRPPNQVFDSLTY